MAKALLEHFRKTISRCLTAGLAEWYKNELYRQSLEMAA